MISYELAKKLKEAGFPQYERRGIGHGDEFFRGNDGELSYAPTLEELIEACGGLFDKLVNMTGNRWDAWSTDFLGDGENKFPLQATGLSPKEAMANLWLAINEKK